MKFRYAVYVLFIIVALNLLYSAYNYVFIKGNPLPVGLTIATVAWLVSIILLIVSLPDE